VDPFAALDDQPPALLSIQLMTMGLFLASYVAAVTRLLGRRGRLRAAGMAFVCGLALCAILKPWTLGALLVAGSVGAIGLFIGLSWALSRVLGMHDRAPVVDDLEAEGATGSSAPLQPERTEAACGRDAPRPRLGAPTTAAPLG
jgi:hypothetical protein